MQTFKKKEDEVYVKIMNGEILTLHYNSQEDLYDFEDRVRERLDITSWKLEPAWIDHFLLRSSSLQIIEHITERDIRPTNTFLCKKGDSLPGLLLSDKYKFFTQNLQFKLLLGKLIMDIPMKANTIERKSIFDLVKLPCACQLRNEQNCVNPKEMHFFHFDRYLKHVCLEKVHLAR